MTRCFERGRDERGIILPLALVILVVVVTLASAMLALGTTEPQIAANLVRGAQALSLAEAGAERGIAYFNANSSCVVAAQNPDYATPPTGCGTGTLTLYTSETLGASSTGSYTVTYTPITFATLLIESTGTTTAGIKRVVRIVVTRQFAGQYGILANNVTVTGNANVNGNEGAVHGNGSVTLSGNDYILQTATTAGTDANCSGCTDSSHVGDAADSGGNRPQVPIPTTTAADYATKATVILGGSPSSCGSCDPAITSSMCSNISTSGSNGIPVYSTASSNNLVGLWQTNTVPDYYVLDARTTTCGLYADGNNIDLSGLGKTKGHYKKGGSGNSGDPFSGFAMDGSNPGQWTLGWGSTTPVAGAYYATDSIGITGGGSTSTPWNATLIAGGIGSPVQSSGQINLSGNPVINSYSSASSTNTWYKNELQMIAGNIKIVGNSGGTTTPLTGTIFATSTDSPPASFQGNVDYSGNAALTGNVIARGSAYVSGSNPGEGKIVYNAPRRSRLLSTALMVVSWHAISTLD